MLRSIPLLVTTAIFTLSAGRKLKDLLSANGHFMMGHGKVYPAWLLPVAFVQEVTMLTLLVIDRPAGVIGCFAFIGGILHANGCPGGPIDKLGAKGAVPAVIVMMSTTALALQGNGHAGPVSRLIGVNKLSAAGLLAAGGAASICGLMVGVLLASDVTGSQAKRT